MIWIIIAVATLSGLGLFTLFKIGLAEMGFAQAQGFWRKVLIVLWTIILVIVLLYLRSKVKQ